MLCLIVCDRHCVNLSELFVGHKMFDQSFDWYVDTLMRCVSISVSLMEESKENSLEAVAMGACLMPFV